jgi:hypothetical protein
MEKSSRRTFLTASASALMARAAFAQGKAPMRAITKGPAFHWFGYYDKLQFDPASRYVLGMETRFENRTPSLSDTIRIGMIDTQDGDRWTDLGETHAWCWQQGCMLQWIPGSSSEIVWNDRSDKQFVAHILNVKTGKRRTLPAPVYALSPDGRWAIHPDFRRLHETRPGYGYAGFPDPNQDVLVPPDSGIWKVNLESGKEDLLFSVADAAKIKDGHSEFTGAKQWFNHLLFAPDGSKFCFLHRWKRLSDITFLTRLITSDPAGQNLFVLDPYGYTSHFIWRDPSHILAWARHPSHGDKFYLYEDRTRNVEVVGPDVMVVNGHCTYLPGNRWILNDTYPDKERNQNPYLYEVRSGTRVPLGHFQSPSAYANEWRCDLHPRFSPDGKKVVIDSPHGGNGRQMYLFDISSIVA